MAMWSRWGVTLGMCWVGAACSEAPATEAEKVALSEEATSAKTPQAVLEAEPAVEVGEIRKAQRELSVYRKAGTTGGVRGIIGKGQSFRVLQRTEGAGCAGEGWGEVEGEGFVCLTKTEASSEAPVQLPQLVPFVHPDPVEWEQYSTTGEYNKAPGDGIDKLVPFIYGKKWRRWKAPHYKSVEAYEKGSAPVGGLESGRKYSFIGAQETSKGTVLLRENGAVVPADEVFLYPISKFHGRDMATEGPADGLRVAWVYNYEGTSLYKEADKKAEVVKLLDYHTPLNIRPVEGKKGWFEVPDAVSPGVSGFVDARGAVRHWADLTPPKGVSDDQLWIDIDLEQQMLALMKGSTPQYITLVSTGRDDTGTPRGIYRVQDKKVWGDMASRDGVLPEDVYYVEKVPWVMHIQGRYALHGAFWHWGFGNTASHGCVNLAPLDAQYLFERITPDLPPGWTMAYQTSEDPGTTVRIRRGQEPPPDKRGKL